MRSINKVILIGNLTRDPEMRETPNGQNVVTFGLATNREWVTRDGRKQSMSEFHELVAWANLADICGKYLKKGKLVYIEGYLKTRSWDTPEGVRKFKTEIVVQDMIMLDKRTSGEEMEYIPQDEPVTSMNDSEPASPAPKPAARIVHKTVAAPVAQKPAAAPADPPPAPKLSPIPTEVDIDQDLGL